MNLKVNILDIKIVNEFDFYWSNEDYINLLTKFDFPDADKSKEEDLLDLVKMAITDFEPPEAAQILLSYKLGDKLSDGQIQSISHEMLNDKVAEEYPEPALHYDLFNINQFLYKAYNGRFPNTEASMINMEIGTVSEEDVEINNELLIKALSAGLKDNNLIKRLFEDQISGEEEFTDAAKSIWLVNKIKENNYQLNTSKYWIDKDDFLDFEFDAEIKFHE